MCNKCSICNLDVKLGEKTFEPLENDSGIIAHRACVDKAVMNLTALRASTKLN